jgi:hypothetical protein
MNSRWKRPGHCLAVLLLRSPAHDPPKCERFGDKIMRRYNNWSATGRKTGSHRRIKSEGMLLLVARPLPGRFAAPAPAAGWYHEEKAT